MTGPAARWVLALTGLAAEAAAVQQLSNAVAVHRVTDLVELLAAARPPLADGVVVAGRFPQMSAAAARQIEATGVRVVALLDDGDDVGSATAADWAVPTQIMSATTQLWPALQALDEAGPVATRSGATGVAGSRGGPLVVVTGTPGAPGTTSVTLGLAAAVRCPALVVDADPVAPCLAFRCSAGSRVTTSAPAPAPALTLRAAARRAALGQLRPRDLLTTDRVSVVGSDPAARLGIGAAGGLRQVIREVADSHRAVIVDAGWRWPGDEPTLAGELADVADVVVSVARPDPLGIRRWLDVSAGLPQQGLVVVWNRAPRAMARRLAELSATVRPDCQVLVLPDDRSGLERWQAGGWDATLPRGDWGRAMRGAASSVVGPAVAGRAVAGPAAKRGRAPRYTGTRGPASRITLG